MWEYFDSRTPRLVTIPRPAKAASKPGVPNAAQGIADGGLGNKLPTTAVESVLRTKMPHGKVYDPE